MFHPWLSRIPAPIGSQEGVEHTHKLALALLIGKCFPQCRLGPPFIIVSAPTCTTFYYPTCTYLLSDVAKHLTIASLSATQRVQEFLITQGGLELKPFSVHIYGPLEIFWKNTQAERYFMILSAHNSIFQYCILQGLGRLLTLKTLIGRLITD